ncbi:3-oxoacyl-[acyl-carrier-protein] synthase III [Hahella chejuensis KCTC 2396]|uniref:3-oxoacyl-[acyl-carrier-protein] synthase III n=1 Tax=Hahella chejuensis (strain KCTC 2396) TaxID=349521 RepID=Q2SAZ3_HAHCH|nr:3-oxoacyl-[acyl-carrier-protein] synthase III C-terminal domain-containing protein [Hahella chejuensis]ABC32181.1 3-oxoacyl-[acyl-carrier-protein] synthase III [Hahella chejuensis KCTC 2396]
MSFVIRSSACYLPQGKVSAEELDQRLSLEPGTCRRRYGVDYRHYASPSETALFMGAEAARAALDRAELQWADIDLLVCASGTPHQALPYNAAGILAELQIAEPLATMDVNASCLSFLAALEFSHCAIASGRYRRVMIVSSEVAKIGVQDVKPETATLFADGAAAFVLEASKNSAGLLTSLFQTYPEGYSLCQIRAGGSGLHPTRNPMEAVAEGSYFEMHGKALYKMVSKLAPDFIRHGLGKAQLTLSDIAHIVPHQASHAGLAHLVHRLGLDNDKVVNLFATMGNQVAASLPIALDHLLRNKRVARGEQVMLFGSAAGLSLGLGVLSL